MIKKLRSVPIGRLVAYLELGADEAQWAALIIFGGVAILFAALIFGLALRMFTCTGGISC